MSKNFVYFTTHPRLIKRMFGDEAVIPFDDAFHLEHAAVLLGIFPNLAQARKNHFEGDIPRGQKKWQVGRKEFWTFRPMLVTDCNNSMVELYQRCTHDEWFGIY